VSRERKECVCVGAGREDGGGRVRISLYCTVLPCTLK
jgi:hypothetical protein